MNHPSVYYFAHPVGPPCIHGYPHNQSGHLNAAHEVACNVARAKRWLLWCWAMAPRVAIIAPWLPMVELLNDADPAHRERGLRDNCAVAAGCDGIVLAGGRLSPGMRRELEAFTRSLPIGHGRPDRLIDLRVLGVEPPSDPTPMSTIISDRLGSLR